MSFTVTPHRLATHGEYLSGLADQIDAAGKSGGGIDFGIESFGLVGQIFSLDARETSRRAAIEIGKFAEHTRKLATGVDDCAKDYRQTDDDIASCLEGIEP
ncbi:ESX-1 secretion-associated protein [Saccharopolyspora sp. K220]|uniref:type VII secretion target n=1 Tax=Saccharopolyspora soli TaxID=2926618 RepID=UPI001F56170A|nr:type VII secretion target [Saccharopolyspora soli]MCI2418637.1 ESX-1 secretion-associated protein [Saccharopolyspora soli]